MSDVRAELSGSVWKIVVQVGDRVERDQEIMILESMKMEIPVIAPHAGTVTTLDVVEEATVDDGDLLARIASE